MKFLKNNQTIVLYCIIAALAVYVIHAVTKTLDNISDAVKKAIPWIAGAAAVVGLALMVSKSKNKETA